MHRKKINHIRHKIKDLYNKLESSYLDGDISKAYKIMPSIIQESADIVEDIEAFLSKVDRHTFDQDLYDELKMTAIEISQTHDFLNTFWNLKPEGLLLH